MSEDNPDMHHFNKMLFRDSDTAINEDDSAESVLTKVLADVVNPVSLDCSICGFPCIEHKHMILVADTAMKFLKSLVTQLATGINIYEQQREWSTCDLPLDTLSKLTLLSKTYADVAQGLFLLISVSLQSSVEESLLDDVADEPE